MHVAIVGNGIAGVTVARELRKRDPDARITLISGESLDHWSRPALMYIYMGHMRFSDTVPYEADFWPRNRIDRVQAWVTHIDLVAKTLSLHGQGTMPWDKLVIATGSVPNRFGWPGQDLNRVSGMYSAGELAALERWSPDIDHGVIVGGGLIGVELAEMLHSRGKHVTMLVRESSYWSNILPAEESAMVGEVIRASGVDLRLGAELQEIHGDTNGSVCGVTLKGGEHLDAQYVGLTAGVRPNVSVCDGSDLTVARGVVVDRQLRTSHPDVFAAGDCAEITTPEGERNLIQAVWYTGRMQGEVVAANLCGDTVDYDSGVWFNSAKFIDLEYQVYGEVPNAHVMAASGAPASLYWQHQTEHKAVRINHRDGVVVGFNLMGVRYRHRVCERWIQEGATLEHVLAHLSEANFDPEFFRKYERAVRAQAAGQRHTGGSV